jgi:thioredoxin-like negative regulator of GroEL
MSDFYLMHCHRNYEKLLADLPAVAANDPTGVAAKIAVAARAVDPEDHEEAHNLIAGAARDLANMRCPARRRRRGG